MTIDQLNEEELLITLEKTLFERNLFQFFKAATRVLYPSIQWQYNWHFKFICDLLQAETERLILNQAKDRDYIFNLPFRSGKSILISIIYPVWVWIKNPALSIITVSATDALATKFGHTSKILISSEWFQQRFGSIFQIRQDQKGKASYMNDSSGRREAFGINAGIIGSGCDIMLLDDVQSPDNVTPLGLKNTIESYTDVLYSRLNNPNVSFRICLQQRCHENDISGYLMRTNPEKYHNIVIPAILSTDLQPKHLAINYVDKLFWHERFSQKVMDDFKATMRPAPYAGQLLQRPVPEEGDLIKRQWFSFRKLSDVLQLNLQWNLMLDTAFTNLTKNDPSGFMIVAKYQNMIIIAKVQRKWLQFHELLEEIKELQKVWKIHRIYVEEKSSGISIYQELQRLTKYNLMKLNPKSKDKVERVIATQPSLQSGRVILVQDDSWNELFLSECASFPFGVHDDLVDTLAYSVEEFLNKSGVTIFK